MSEANAAGATPPPWWSGPMPAPHDVAFCLDTICPLCTLAIAAVDRDGTVKVETIGGFTQELMGAFLMTAAIEMLKGEGTQIPSDASSIAEG